MRLTHFSARLFIRLWHFTYKSKKNICNWAVQQNTAQLHIIHSRNCLQTILRIIQEIFIDIIVMEIKFVKFNDLVIGLEYLPVILLKEILNLLKSFSDQQICLLIMHIHNFSHNPQTQSLVFVFHTNSETEHSSVLFRYLYCFYR